MSVGLRASEGEAALDGIEEERVYLCASFPAPPGSLLRLSLSDETELKVKVRSCRRSEGGSTFAIEGRLVDAPRTVRARLIEALELR